MTSVGSVELKKHIKAYCLKNDIKHLFDLRKQLALYSGSERYIAKFLDEDRPMGRKLENKLREFFKMELLPQFKERRRRVKDELHK